MSDPTTAAPADPSAASADDNDTTGGAYTIEISVAGDGSITVGVESADEENSEEAGSDAGASAGGAAPAAGGDDDEGAAQPAKNIKDALVMALEIYKNNGEAPGPDDSDQQFAAGYGGGQS